MRWSHILNSPALVAGASEDKSAVLRLGPDAAGRKASVGIFLDDDILDVSVLAEGLPDAGSRPDHPEWGNRACLAVLLNPAHDHATRWLYAVDDRCTLVQEAHWALPGEEAGDDGAAPLDAPPKAQGVFAYRDACRFAARLRIPTNSLWSSPESPAGLTVKVGFHEARIPPALAWPKSVPWTGDTPLVFGDLYRRPPALQVTEIEIPEPTWGGNPASITVRGVLVEDAPRSGRVQVRVTLPGDSDPQQPDTIWQSDRRDVDIPISLVFPFRAKWANGLRDIARLHLAILGDGNRMLWQGSYPFGFDHGIIVRERFGPAGEQPSPRPQPANPDFLDAFRAYILTRLPDYRQRTTREGAPSDFYLEDPAGVAHLDLSAADVLDRTADMLAERFPDWQDALCAAAMWVHHPMITRHSSTWSRVSNIASLDTIPRLAGCFCGDTTRLTASLAEKIAARLGVPLNACSMGLRGHLATLVDTPIGPVVIDGMLGLWFHTLDNIRLATLDEMRSCKEIAERVWYAPRAHGHEFFYGTHNQLIRPWKDGPLQWPQALG